MKRLTIFFLAAAMAASCSEKPTTTPGPEPSPEKLPIRISAETKITSEGFEYGDQVGLYVTDESEPLRSDNNHVTNMRFTNYGSWEPETQIYWKDKDTRANFYCYFPYCGYINNIASHHFTVQSDQIEEYRYKESDFLWGKTESASPSTDAVDITVKHMMSKVIVELIAGNGYTQEDMNQASVEICGLYTTASIDLSNGNVSPVGEVHNILPLVDGSSRRALVVPQSVYDADIIKVRIGTNTHTLKQTVTFESGKQHTCTITVNKTSQGINIGIGGWESADEDFGGTVE